MPHYRDLKKEVLNSMPKMPNMPKASAPGERGQSLGSSKVGKATSGRTRRAPRPARKSR